MGAVKLSSFKHLFFFILSHHVLLLRVVVVIILRILVVVTVATIAVWRTGGDGAPAYVVSTGMWDTLPLSTACMAPIRSMASGDMPEREGDISAFLAEFPHKPQVLRSVGLAIFGEECIDPSESQLSGFSPWVSPVLLSL